jgi:organic radical activating enzyme
MTYPVKIKSYKPNNILDVTWDITNHCNFHCRYCFPGSNAATHKVEADLNLLVKNFTYLASQYKTKLGKDFIHLKFSGGEPTLWKDFGKFILKLKEENNLYIGIISNGSRTLRWWQEYGHLIDNATISFHIAEADIDHTIAVADTLSKLGKKVTVLVLMDPSRWDDCIAAVHRMKTTSKEKWFIEAKTIVDTADFKVTYTEEQQQYLLKEIKRMPSVLWFIKNIKLIVAGLVRRYQSVTTLDDGSLLKMRSSGYVSRGWDKFLGWTCSIGLETLYIKWDGSIKGSCGQTIYGLDYSYNILDSNFVVKYNPQFKTSICQQRHCVCLPDTHVSKLSFSQRNIGSTRTIIPIAENRL